MLRRDKRTTKEGCTVEGVPVRTCGDDEGPGTDLEALSGRHWFENGIEFKFRKIKKTR